MKILFCVEFYFPSIGGAQEVVRQVAEHMVLLGHEVCVATSHLAFREAREHHGVKIIEFPIVGNQVRGMFGPQADYQKLLVEGGFDVVMFYAAQQWTFDAAWPVLSQMKARKVLVPCGYSGLYEPAYQTYFEELPAILRQFDALIYHAENYRDVNYGKQHQLGKEAFIPNGADLREFDVPRDEKFRRSLGVEPNTAIILTVGSMTGMKGHMELLKAYAELDLGARKSLLILNGNTPHGLPNALKHLIYIVRTYGLYIAIRYVAKKVLIRLGFKVGKDESLKGLAQEINRTQGGNKSVRIIDMPRKELVQAYLNSDLFVFASNIEYSPLVLFEACAAGLPFLAVPVGNSVEIAQWTGAGEICDAPSDERGYTRVEPKSLARKIETLLADSNRLEQLHENGSKVSRARYNWDKLTREYEGVFKQLLAQQPK